MCSTSHKTEAEVEAAALTHNGCVIRASLMASTVAETDNVITSEDKSLLERTVKVNVSIYRLCDC